MKKTKKEINSRKPQARESFLEKAFAEIMPEVEFVDVTPRSGGDIAAGARQKLDERGEFNDEDLFDDCPVCQAMKAAKEKGEEPTEAELKEAFERAKEQGGIVGGEWFKNG